MFFQFIQFKNFTALIFMAQISQSKSFKIKWRENNFKRSQTSGKHIRKHFYIQNPPVDYLSIRSHNSFRTPTRLERLRVYIKEKHEHFNMIFTREKIKNLL